MGLHLNFELRLPASTSAAGVTACLEQLRAFALTQPFENVSALFSPEFDANDDIEQERSLLQRRARVISKPDDEDDRQLVGEPKSTCLLVTFRWFASWNTQSNSG